MPLTTPRLALPYPVPDDSVDVPRDVQALATKLDGISGITPAIVTTLPVGPVEGQECVWSPTITRKNGASLLSDPYWRMRYVAGKWRYLGGTRFACALAASFAFTALGGGYLSLKTRISIPAVGDWIVTVAASLSGLSTTASPMLSAGQPNDAAALSSWADLDTSPGTTSVSANLSGFWYKRIAVIDTYANFESFVSSPGQAVNGTVAWAQLMLEPVFI